MSAPKAAPGERKKQALEAIREFERKQQLWSTKDLASVLGCSLSQAGQLTASLTFSGDLVRGERTVVIPEALITAA